MIAISLVIPCYNEENNLKKGVLDQLNSYLKKAKFSWEVLLCNDGSTDKSLSLLTQYAQKHDQFKVLDLPHGGKPSAVWGGIQKAKYPHILLTDMDQSTPIQEIEKLLPYFNQDYDIVIGSRGTSRDGNSLLRKIGSKVFLFARRALLLPQIFDTQCGFKALKTQTALDIFPHLQFFEDTSEKTGWRVSAYDVELLFIAQKWGYKIKEVPVIWKNEDISTTKGDADARYKKESVQMIQEIVRILTNNFHQKYEKVTA